MMHQNLSREKPGHEERCLILCLSHQSHRDPASLSDLLYRVNPMYHARQYITLANALERPHHRYILQTSALQTP